MMEIAWPRVLLWGVFSTGLLTLILVGSQGLGWTRISLPYLLGTMVTPHRSRAMILGSLLHLGLGCLFAALYALVLREWGEARWWKGTLLGLYHGLFVMVVGMYLMPWFHPRMASLHNGPTPTRQLEPPGFLGLHYGRGTPALTLLAHAVYGTMLGVAF